MLTVGAVQIPEPVTSESGAEPWVVRHQKHLPISSCAAGEAAGAT